MSNKIKSVSDNKLSEFFNTEQLYTYFFTNLKNLAVSRFIYEGMTLIEQKYIEDCLFNHGVVMCDKDPIIDKPIYSYFGMSDTLNVYRLPSKIWAIYGNGLTGDYKNIDDVAFIFENFYCNNLTLLKTDYYASLLTLYTLTSVGNLNKQKFPYIIEGTNKTKLSMLNVGASIENFENAIYTENGSNVIDKIKLLDLKVPLIVEDIERCKKRCLNEYLTFLGILNNSSEKSERLITNESVNDNGETDINRLNAINIRKDFCNQINEKFNMNVSVKWIGGGATTLEELKKMLDLEENKE